MTDKERKVIFTLIGVLIAILVIILTVKGVRRNKLKNSVSNSENTSNEEYVTSFKDLGSNVKLNNSTEFNSTKTYNNIEFSKIRFIYQNGSSTLTADLKNVGSSKHEEEIVTLSILGTDGFVIVTLDASIPTLEPGETSRLNASATADIINAKDFKIEAK